MEVKSEETNEIHSPNIQKVLQLRLYRTIEFVKSASKQIAIGIFIWCFGYFNFSFLWIICGVFLITLFADKLKWKKFSAQSSKLHSDNPKQILKSATEMFHLSGSHLPSWMYYPDVEKAEWMNAVIQQLWPFIVDYVKQIITEQIQPSVRESSTLLSNFTFSEVDLGQRAPRVSAVKVYGQQHTRRNEIIIDMQVVFDSECNIGITVNRLHAGISNFRLSGLLRIELQSLIGTMPLVGAVSASFVKDPVVDFDLTHLANLFDFPGLDVVLRGAIADSINSKFVLPEKYIHKLCPESNVGRLRYFLPKGVLRIHVKSAKNLEEKDLKVLGIGGKSDPFVDIKVGRKQSFKTKILLHTLNPIWNESFDAIISDLQYTNIEFRLYDDDGALSKADFLGSASLPAKTVFECGVVDKEINLSGVRRGQLHVRLEWFDLSDDLADLSEALKRSSNSDTLHSAILNVYVDSAQRLPHRELDTYNPSPVLKITAPGLEAIKTKVISNTNNPIWEENFHFLLRKPDFDQIVFEVEDNAVEERNLLGIMRYSVKQLLSSSELTTYKPFTLQNSGIESVLNLRMILRILKLKPETAVDDNITFSVVPPNIDNPPDDEKIYTQPTNTASQQRSSREQQFTIEKTAKPSKQSEKKSPDKKTRSVSIREEKEKPKDSRVSESQSVGDVVSLNSRGSFEFEGSPIRSPKNVHERFPVSRSASIASEISHAGEVSDLRKRLNAKKNLENGGNSTDHGLGRIQLTIRYRKNVLVVLVVRAENLIICDEQRQTSDPYVRVYIIPNKNQRKKTKVIKRNLNPTFDEKLEFPVSSKEVTSKKLDVTVKNQTGFLSSEKVLMGHTIIDLSVINLSQSTTKWYDLKLPDKT